MFYASNIFLHFFYISHRFKCTFIHSKSHYSQLNERLWQKANAFVNNMRIFALGKAINNYNNKYESSTYQWKPSRKWQHISCT